MENKRQMRNLKTTDIFKMSKILSKMDVSFGDVKVEGMSQQQVGMELIKVVIENLHKAEDEVNDFMGSLVGMSGEEFGELELDESFAIIQQFKELKGLSGFFKSVTKAQGKK